jgi:lysozyme
MNTSSVSVLKIMEFEGTRMVPYDDIAGNATVGVGHLLHKGTCTAEDKPITRDQAEKLFELDIKTKAEVFVNKYVRVPLNQNQFDALVDFCYNLGCGTLLNLLSETGLNHGTYDAVSPEILKYDKAHVGGKLVSIPGLTRRRKWEAELFVRVE